jgi:hypothetical protein
MTERIVSARFGLAICSKRGTRGAVEKGIALVFANKMRYIFLNVKRKK